MSDSPVVPGGSRSLLRMNRFEAFSDGVFAIAITILVLELGVPETAVEHPLQAVLDEWPTYVAYVVSFASVGALWLEHNAITDVDTTACDMIEDLDRALEARHLRLIFAEMKSPVRAKLSRYGLDQALPDDRFSPR